MNNDRDIIISVIVPVYNMEKYLERFFQCLENQTFQNFETVLVNDGSVDYSLRLCEDFANRHKDVIILNQENSGVSSARNAGIDVANGKYLAFSDPDDEMDVEYLATLVNYADKYQAEIMSCCALVRKDSSLTKNSFWKNSFDKCIALEPERVITQILSNKYYKDADNDIDIGVVWGKLYRSDFVAEHNFRFREGLVSHEDAEFNLKAFQEVKAIYYIDCPLYVYQYYNGENARRKDPIKVEQLYLSCMEMQSEYIKHYNVQRDTPVYIAYQIRFLEYLFCVYRYSFFELEKCESKFHIWKRFHKFHRKQIVKENIKQISYSKMEPFLDRKERMQLKLIKIHLESLVYLLRISKNMVKRS